LCFSREIEQHCCHGVLWSNRFFQEICAAGIGRLGILLDYRAPLIRCALERGRQVHAAKSRAKKIPAQGGDLSKRPAH
jgi:hypothetical protein